MPAGPIILTFAELAFLLPSESDSVRDRLRLQRWEPESPVLLSGAASLFARGLLQLVEDDVVVPVEEVATVIGATSSAEQWAEVSFARESEAGSLQVFGSGDVRVDVVALPFGAFSFVLQEDTANLADAIESAVSVFLSEPNGGAAFVRRAPDEGNIDIGLAVRRSPDGVIEMTSGAVDDAAIRAVTLQEALSEVRAFAS